MSDSVLLEITLADVRAVAVITCIALSSLCAFACGLDSREDPDSPSPWFFYAWLTFILLGWAATGIGR